jgi:hypothetical protein
MCHLPFSKISLEELLIYPSAILLVTVILWLIFKVSPLSLIAAFVDIYRRIAIIIKR